MENEIKNKRNPGEETDSDKQEFKGRNLEDAISHAEHVLKTTRNLFNYEIVAEKTRLFGIKTKEIVIRVWPKKAAEEKKETEFLDRLLKIFPLDLKYSVKRNHDMLFFVFDGPDKNLLLQKDGALLLAFQHILNKISEHKVQTDCDFFRKRRERELKEYVQHIARRVRDTGKIEILDLMNPYERRLVHIAVNAIPGITTESMGDGFMKKVKVFPARGRSNHRPHSQRGSR
jgi:spoIIIJ-associated protein